MEVGWTMLMKWRPSIRTGPCTWNARERIDGKHLQAPGRDERLEGRMGVFSRYLILFLKCLSV